MAQPLGAAAGDGGGLVATVGLLVLYATLWTVLRPYGGLGHDAQAYAIEALVKIRPDIYASDLFLRYRSQDEFTIFPALYADLIELQGLETAAATAVLVCQLLWFSVAFLIVKRLTGTTLALFALGLLLTLPGNYGSFHIFAIAEPFMTARLPAEVLSLLAIWLFLERKPATSALVLIAGLAIHPLMAFPVAALLVCTWISHRTPKSTVPALLLAGIVVAIIGSLALGGSSPYIEDRWLAISKLRSGFLFVDQWRSVDWSDALVILFTLLLASVTLPSREARSLAGCSLGVGLAGIALAAISSLWLELEILIQGQPWRWLWIAKVCAIGLLPAVIVALWRKSAPSSSAAILLVAAWLFVAPVVSRSQFVQVLPAMLSGLAVALWLARSRITGDADRIVWCGAWATLAAVLISTFVTIALAWEIMSKPDGGLSTTSDALLAATIKFGTPAAVLTAISCFAMRCAWTPVRGVLVGALGASLGLLLAPAAVDAWTARPFTGPAYAAFEDWRRIIPKESEVLWYDNLRETWFLLERRAYLTRSQSGGVVFSEELAEEVIRRALVLEPYIDRNFWFVTEAGDANPHPLTKDILLAICRDPELNFLVSEDNAGQAIAKRNWPSNDRFLYLYGCADFRARADG